jgi:hypothetical protein
MQQKDPSGALNEDADTRAQGRLRSSPRPLRSSGYGVDFLIISNQPTGEHLVLTQSEILENTIQQSPES